MKNRAGILKSVGVLAALACAGALHAHHSVSMFDISTPVWLKATFTGFDRVNPHSIIHLEETTADGQIRSWSIEGQPAAQLDRRAIEADFLQPGDVIEVCGFALKEEYRSVRSPQIGRGYPPDFLHGHMLVMPDGTMKAWGSYGKLMNCIRPGDRVQTWIDFVNGDPRAWQLWCGGRGFTLVPTIAPPEFVADVDRGLDQPCD
jgi:hypothetical protein